MRLCDDDRRLFYRLNWHLLYYVSQQLEVLPRPHSPEEIEHGSEEGWLKLRDGLYGNPGLFDSFADSNPFGFSPEELATVRSWKHFVRGNFFIWRYFRKYTVFMDKQRVYGVVALNKPFEYMLGPQLPRAVVAVLLPFRGCIVYDGLFSEFPVRFGPGIKKVLDDSYREAKANGSIVTSLQGAA
jgi:hypothetical protein